MLWFRQKKNRKKDERGSLTVEATLVLPLVIITWLSLINILNIYLCHVVIQQGLNNTAKRLSEYCYLLERFGAYDDVKKVLAKESATVEKANNTVSSATSTIDNIKELDGNLNDTLTTLKGGITGINTLMDLLNKGDEIVKDVGAVKDSATELAKALKSIKTENVVDYLESELLSATAGGLVGLVVNQYIDGLNVSDKVVKPSEISYYGSRFLYSDNNYITLIASYHYENPLSFRFTPYKEIPMEVMVTVSPWVGYSDSGLQNAYAEHYGGN